MYRLSFSRISLAEKPGKEFPWAEYMATFEAQDVEPIDILDKVGRGFGFAPIFGGDGYPRLENFMETQFICVDMDTEDERSSMETLSSHPLVSYHGAIIYPTHSHREEAPRHRVIFLLDRPIRNAETAKLALLTFASFFEGSDTNLSANKTWQANGRIDADGLWDKVALSGDFNLTPEQVVTYVAQYQAQQRKKEDQQRKREQRHYESNTKDEYMSVKELSDRLYKVDPYSMDYTTWVKLGASIARSYGQDAFWLFKDWSDRPGKTPLTMGKYKSLMNDHPSAVGYSTLIYLLKERSA